MDSERRAGSEAPTSELTLLGVPVVVFRRCGVAAWCSARGRASPPNGARDAPTRPSKTPVSCRSVVDTMTPRLGLWFGRFCGRGRVSRPSGRRPSSCDQCGSTAATAPRRGLGAPADGGGRHAGRPRACCVATPGRSAGCRGARRRERTSWHTRHASLCLAAAHTAGARRCTPVAGARAALRKTLAPTAYGGGGVPGLWQGLRYPRVTQGTRVGIVGAGTFSGQHGYDMGVGGGRPRSHYLPDQARN